MTAARVNRWIGTGGVTAASKWSRAAVVAAALLLGLSSPSGASDIGSIFGGVVGGMIGQSMQQQQPHYYQPQPQYYQQQPQYYQQPQTYQRRSGTSSAEARRQAELKRQKEQQQEKEKKEQEAAAAAAATPVVGDASGPIDVAMKRKNGNLWVPAQINKVVTIDFVIDSGASDITLPRDVYLTLIRSGTLTKANYIGAAQFGIADGSEVKGLKFKLASLQVGNQTLTDVVASVMPSDNATPLLGLSFLSRFQSWAIDNNSGTLKLTPISTGNPTGGTPTQVAQAAGATPQPLPEPPAAETAAPATPTLAAAATPQPQPEQAAAPEARVAAAAPAPRSGDRKSTRLNSSH